jgi:hypothetical protein
MHAMTNTVHLALDYLQAILSWLEREVLRWQAPA